jgi:hypothetical protein
VINVPAGVRSRACAAGAGAWLERLPSLVPGLEADQALACTRIDLQPLGRDTLRAVEAVASMTIG